MKTKREPLKSILGDKKVQANLKRIIASLKKKGGKK